LLKGSKNLEHSFAKTFEANYKNIYCASFTTTIGYYSMQLPSGAAHGLGAADSATGDLAMPDAGATDTRPGRRTPHR